MRRRASLGAGVVAGAKAVCGPVARPSRLTACLALAIALTAACATMPPPTIAGTHGGREAALAVVTWNMHAGRGDLPRLVDDLRSGRLSGGPVRQYVLLLQESIEDGQYDVVRFAKARGLSTFFVPLWVSRHGVSGNAILSSVPLIDPMPIELPHERRVRRAVAATLDVGGTPLFAVSAHLENRIAWTRGGLFSDSARGRQARALVRLLPAGPGIVGGDFNTWLGPDEPALRAMNERFTDTPTVPLPPTFHDRLVLDHLFFDLPRGWSAAREVLHDRYGSDHHPVLGVVFDAGAARNPEARS